MSLRALLIQRGARLQEYPALTAPGWGELRYPAFRNRVEGIALGLLAPGRPPGTPCHSATGSPWDWACEVACAACGLRWDPEAGPADPDLFGGPAFNAEAGRQLYHDREQEVLETTPFAAGLDHGELLRRLARLNRSLGWDHTTSLWLPLDQSGTPAGRAALWSALYAGSHATLGPGGGTWASKPFEGFWSEGFP